MSANPVTGNQGRVSPQFTSHAPRYKNLRIPPTIFSYVGRRGGRDRGGMLLINAKVFFFLFFFFLFPAAAICCGPGYICWILISCDIFETAEFSHNTSSHLTPRSFVFTGQDATHCEFDECERRGQPQNACFLMQSAIFLRLATHSYPSPLSSFHVPFSLLHQSHANETIMIFVQVSER